MIIAVSSDKRRNYRNGLAGLYQIAKKEGTPVLWSGAVATMGRAAIVNGTQLGTYSRSKRLLLETGSSHCLQLVLTVLLISSCFLLLLFSAVVGYAVTKWP